MSIKVQLAYSRINLEKSYILKKGDSYFNLNNFRSFLAITINLGLFKEDTKVLSNSLFYKKTSDMLTLMGVSDLYEQSKVLINKIEVLLAAIHDLYPEPEELSINVKLSSADDLESISKSFQKLNKVLGFLVLNKDINGGLKVKRWDTGSHWMEIMVNTAAAVSIIAAATWSAMVIFKKYNEALIFEEHAKGLNMKNEFIEEMVQAQKKLIKQVVENEARNINDEFFGGQDHEQQARLMHTIETLSDLIKDGTEIHPSLLAPENVKNLFPDISNIMQLESKTRLLTDEKRAVE